MSRKKKDKSAQSTRQLMGIDSVKDYCIATARSFPPYASFWSRTAHTWTAFRC